MPDAIEVRKVPLHTVSDASELGTLIDEGVFEADRVVAVIGKTEGNGGVNDYTRIIADRAFREILVEKGADPARVKEVPIVWSGGTDGVTSPHATIFATVPADRAEQTDERRLTVGFALGEIEMPTDADGIWAAIKDAGLDLPERPHRSDIDGRLVNVFLKCEASLDGQVAGRRNAMLDDSDVHWHRQIKSCVGGVTASVTGDPAVFVSVSAAHQGPDGGGPVAAIVDLGRGEPTGYRPPTAR